MGSKRHTVDEEKFNCQSANHSLHFDTADCDRRFALKGYLKLVLLAIGIIFVLLFRNCVLDRIIVSGESMMPTYSDGDVMWARKFGMDQLHRYDVVTLKVNGKVYIKRVIGLPDETVQIVDGKVYINGSELVDDYGEQTVEYGCAIDEVKLSSDEYFLMGDNRNNSIDSRRWGAVSIDKIESVIIFQIFPFDKIGKVR